MEGCLVREHGFQSCLGHLSGESRAYMQSLLKDCELHCRWLGDALSAGEAGFGDELRRKLHEELGELNFPPGP